MPSIEDKLQALPKRRVVLLVGLALALLASSIGLFSISQFNRIVTSDVRATTTVRAKTIATAYVSALNLRARTTATAQAVVAATVRANATATASAIGATATAFASGNPYPPHDGMLALDDTLSNNSSSGWVVYQEDNGGCRFAGGAYQARMTQQQLVKTCFADNTDFTDFVYEVDMKILAGDEGGLLFRASSQNATGYYFTIDRSGNYGLEIYKSANDVQLLTSGALPSFLPDQPNLLAVIARGSQMSLYVNMQHIDDVRDSTYTRGQIGVTADEASDSTEVVYSNAKVWTL